MVIKRSNRPALEPDLEIGDFKLLKRLGKGGMGEVWLARQASLDRDVAIKFLVPAEIAQDELIKRLKIEALSAARIQHPNVISIYALTTFHNQPIIVMEYASGSTLRELLKKGRRFTLQEILQIIEEVACGLKAAHAVNVIHRDIKPSNLFISEENHVKILDFGLARIQTDPSFTKTITVLGTVQYMSPEQITGKTVDCRSDFYSLGIILFEMLNGYLPFRSRTPIEITRAHLESPVPEMNDDLVPPPVKDLVLDLLQKDPKKRPLTAQELISKIELTRQKCRGLDIETQNYYSRSLELQLLENATQNLKQSKGPWSPKRVKHIVVIALIFAITAYLFWPHPTSAQRLALPLDLLPRNTKIILDNREIEPPFPAFLTIRSGVHQIVIQSPFYKEKIIPFSSNQLPKQKDLIPEPDVQQIYRSLLEQLDQSTRKPVNLSFLHDLYPNSRLPTKLQQLRREIIRLNKASQALKKGNPKEAVNLLESLPPSQRHPITRRTLELARIYLLPDEELRTSLTRLQKYIQRGEDIAANREIERLNKIRPNLYALQEFSRQLDQLLNFRRGAQRALIGGYLESMENTLKKWAEIAPDDPDLKAYQERLNNEKQLRILKSNQNSLLSTLKRYEDQWNPWFFYFHLEELMTVGEKRELLRPFFERTQKKVSQDFCRRLTKFLQDPNNQNGLKGFPLKKAQQQSLELKKLGWIWIEQSITPKSLSRKENELLMRCEYFSSGKFPGSKTMTINQPLKIVISIPIKNKNPSEPVEIIISQIEKQDA